jgi:DNA processing protein
MQEDPTMLSDPDRAGTAAPAEQIELVRQARAWLLRAVIPGSVRVRRLVAEVGPVAATAALRAGTTPEAADVAVCPGLDEAAADLQWAAKRGARFVIPEDAEWPTAAFAAFARAAERGHPEFVQPLGLWVRGYERLDAVLTRAVALIGSNNGTAYGRHISEYLTRGLAQSMWAVVCSGEFGIAAACARAAMHAGGTVVIVLPSGLDKPYPSGHTQLFDMIVNGASNGATGLLVSEWPLNQPARRDHLPFQARLIAGLGAATVVVEAGPASSTLTTAGYARTLGRPVLAIPGPADSFQSAGTHSLIRDHQAVLATNPTDVLLAVESNTPPADTAPEQTAPPTAETCDDHLSTPAPADEVVCEAFATLALPAGLRDGVRVRPAVREGQRHPV